MRRVIRDGQKKRVKIYKNQCCERSCWLLVRVVWSWVRGCMMSSRQLATNL